MDTENLKELKLKEIKGKFKIPINNLLGNGFGNLIKNVENEQKEIKETISKVT